MSIFDQEFRFLCDEVKQNMCDGHVVVLRPDEHTAEPKWNNDIRLEHLSNAHTFKVGRVYKGRIGVEGI